MYIGNRYHDGQLVTPKSTLQPLPSVALAARVWVLPSWGGAGGSALLLRGRRAPHEVRGHKHVRLRRRVQVGVGYPPPGVVSAGEEPSVPRARVL